MRLNHDVLVCSSKMILGRVSYIIKHKINAMIMRAPGLACLIHKITSLQQLSCLKYLIKSSIIQYISLI